jgi:hypothetical protein
MKIEQGRIFPSSELVSEMFKALEEQDSERLVLIFCRHLFPKQNHLFPLKKESMRAKKSEKGDPESEIQIQASRGQKFLNLRQVHALSQSEEHYDVFLLLILARRPLTVSELEEEGHYKDKLEKIMKDFVEVRLARTSSEGVSLIHTDFAFPAPSTNSILPEIYKKLDSWDQKISDTYQFEILQKRTFLRRISNRHLNLIMKNLEFTFDLIKSSDEIEKKHNESVIHFQVLLKSGKMPG